MNLGEVRERDLREQRHNYMTNTERECGFLQGSRRH